MELQEVKDVAIYPRKSRGDDEHALDKHRKELTELAQRYGWRYQFYEEIGSADSIDFRPQFVRLLADVRDGLYDAVLVMDLDRLSRGDLEDQARWRKVFESTGTLIVTPQRVYNLSDDSSILMADVEGLFARMEYRTITRRLRRGKRIGAAMGRWTNGPAPMPYVYDPTNRQLVVDTEKLEVYNLIKERVLAGAPLYKLAVELNLAGIKSPKGGTWTATVIHRLITSEVHLGKIVAGKTEGSAHRNRKTKPYRKKPRDEWTVSEGTHQAVKTPEEHARILGVLERRRLVPVAARRGRYPLSGLVRCGLCGAVMQFITKPSGKVDLKKCQHMDPYGKVCTNRGVGAQIIYETLNAYLTEYEAKLRRPGDGKGTRGSGLAVQIKAKEKDLHALEEGVERIQELYIAGRLTKAAADARLEKQDVAVRQKRAEIAQLREAAAASGLTDQERIKRLTDLHRAMTDATVPPVEQNRFLQQVIDHIAFTRIGDEVTIDIEPL